MEQGNILQESEGIDGAWVWPGTLRAQAAVQGFKHAIRVLPLHLLCVEVLLRESGCITRHRHDQLLQGKQESTHHDYWTYCLAGDCMRPGDAP